MSDDDTYTKADHNKEPEKRVYEALSDN